MAADGIFKKTLPPPPAVAEVGFLEEFLNGIPQGPPEFVFKLTEGLADPNNPPAVDDMVTFSKGTGRTAFSVAKAI